MSDKELMAAIGNFGNGHDGCCCNDQCGQNNTITQIDPKTEQPVKEDTETRDGAHNKLDANAELYDMDKMQAMANRMMSNLVAKDMTVRPTLSKVAEGEINLISAEQPEGDVLNV